MYSNRLRYLPLLLLFPIFLTEAIPLQRLKLEGVFQDGQFIVERVKERDPDKDPRAVRISGRISEFDGDARVLKIAGRPLYWRASKDSVVKQFKMGVPVEINAVLDSSGRASISSIEMTTLDVEDAVEIIGFVESSKRSGEWNEISIAGISALTPRRLYNNGRVRISRLDDRRPDDQLNFRIGELQFTIGGEIELGIDIEDEIDLQSSENDGRFDLEPGFQLEAFVEGAGSVSAFFELKGEHGLSYDLPLAYRDEETELSRGESWVHFDGLFSLPMALQIGRQNFAEQREWWWDDDLDAISLSYRDSKFRAYVAVAEEIAKVVFNDDHRDAEEEDVFRILSNANWRHSSEFILDVFFLYERDHSNTPALGQVVPFYREDEVDAELYWFGTRFSGEFDIRSIFEAAYWIDWALVRGDETQLEFDDLDDLRFFVESRRDFDRSGEAVDVGTSIRWRNVNFGLFYDPTLTIGFAWGSGDDGGRNGFKETGLNDNNWRFNGVDRFRYYGELTNPRLENLSVSTLSLGFRFLSESSIEILHHNYTQVDKTDFHSLRIDPDTNGLSQDIGDEIDVVIGIEEWQNWEFEFVTAYFLPGDAFNEQDNAWQFSFKLNYNF